MWVDCSATAVIKEMTHTKGNVVASLLKVFGCDAYALISDCNQKKLGGKAEKLR